MSQFSSAIAGFSASLSTLIFFPLEMIRVQMISGDGFSNNSIPKYQSSFHALAQIYRTQGFASLYRGCHISLFSSVAWSIYFFFYERAKQRYSKEFISTHPELYRILVAAEAAVISKVITNPMWVIKTRIMLQRNSKYWYGETLEAVKKIWKVDGAKGYFSGLVPGLVLCLNGAFQLYCYELLKEVLQSQDSTQKTALAGGSSKVLSTLLLYPMQTVMIRLQQEQYSASIGVGSANIKQSNLGNRFFEGFRDCVTKTYINMGMKGFYRGISIQLLRIVPNNALFFVVYEWMYKRSYALLTRQR